MNMEDNFDMAVSCMYTNVCALLFYIRVQGS